jgi:hypothetical protein
VKRPSWIVLLLVAVAIVAAVLRSRLGSEDVSTTPSASVSAALPSAADEYVRFAERVQIPSGPAAVQAIAEGLRRLAGAVTALDPVDPALPVDLRVSAEHLALNERSIANARLVRDHLLAVSQRLPDGPSAERAESAARAIDPGTPLPDQASSLEEFFRASAEALR